MAPLVLFLFCLLPIVYGPFTLELARSPWPGQYKGGAMKDKTHHPLLDPAAVLSDRAASFWLKDAINSTERRDPLDTLIDAKALAAVARWRLAQVLAAPVSVSDDLAGDVALADILDPQRAEREEEERHIRALEEAERRRWDARSPQEPELRPERGNDENHSEARRDV